MLKQKEHYYRTVVTLEIVDTCVWSDFEPEYLALSDAAYRTIKEEVVEITKSEAKKLRAEIMEWIPESDTEE